MDGLFASLFRRLEPREGWLVFLAPLIPLMLVPLALSGAGWVSDLGWPTTTALTLGYLAGFTASRIVGARGQSGSGWRRYLPGVVAGILLFATGLLVVTLLVWWRQAPQVAEEVRWYLRPLAHSGLAIQEAAVRLWQWGQDATGAGAAQDDSVFRWLVCLAVWLAGSWAGWWYFRHQRTLLALLPAGAIIVLNAYFYWEGRIFLPLFLGTAVVVQVLMERRARETRWQRLDMDYSRDVRLDILFTAIGLGILVFGASSLMPRLVVRPTASWFAGVVSEPTSDLEEQGRQLFPGLQRSPRSLLARGGGSGSLPRSFLLGSGPELSEILVMRVSTGQLAVLPPWEEPPAAARHYWRAMTNDTYDGRGWSNSPIEESRHAAGEPWAEQDGVFRQTLRQMITLERGGDRALYAAGEALAPNRPYESYVRRGSDAPFDDLVALITDGRRYDVISMVPAADEAALRAAGTDYLSYLRDSYLELPEIPDRVRLLAQEVAGDAETSFDQALILEEYLRGYRYDLDVAPPPPGRDVVDFFLFDQQAGYCDYYASSMVVLARSLGIPARLAVGYATGDFDPEARAFLVHEDDAHSWAELYFPGVGWVPFEPTASRATFVRQAVPGDAGTRMASAEQLAVDLQTFHEDEILRRRVRRIVVVLLVGLAALLLWVFWRRRPEPGLEGMYEQLGRWGGRLGRPAGVGETPSEFGQGLSIQVDSLSDPQADRASQGIKHFITDFETAQYGPVSGEAEAEARQVWRRLDPALRRLWLRWGWRRGPR
ncbi:MAG: transglutaminaseTgpA domain-containing protein [Chloroflexota bacterium]|nr:transglutaminaseTgpA domain-containing protein [Chloroflexota bacterium]